MVPGSLTRKHIHLLSPIKPKASKASEDLPTPQDRQELPSCTIVTLPSGGKHKWSISPRKPIQSTATLVPAPHHSPIHLSSPKTSSSLPLQGASQPIADIHSAHMLTSDSSVKYQCICCLGDVPKTSCTIHTNHSLFLFVFYLFLSFFCV